jgi:cell division protein FtsX
LAPDAARLAAAYGQSYSLAGPTVDELGLLLLGGLVLGWIGAALASGYEIARSAPGSA